MFNIAKFFLGAFTTAAGWFVGMVSRRTAIVLAVATVIIGMTTALSLTFKFLISGLSSYATLVVPPQVLMGLGMVIPENLEVCVAAMFSARIGLWAYRFNKDLLQMYLGGI